MKDITSLTNITSNYLKQGNKPRVLVHVADARDGTVEGRYWASQAYTTNDGNAYSDRIKSVQSIRSTIEPFGGMSAVSGTNLSILKADTDIQFHQTSVIDAKPHAGSGLEGHGRLLNSNSTYAYARTSPADNISYSAITVGQYKGITNYNVYRGFLQFQIPTLTSIEDAYITLQGDSDYSAVDFEIYLCEGTWNDTTYGIDMFASYNATQLNETFETGTGKNFTASGLNYFRFNRTGRDLIKDTYSNSTLRLMLVSKEDINSSRPGEGIPYNEFVKFTTSTMPTLTLQYNTVKPDNRTAKVYICYADSSETLPTDEDNMLQLWTGVVDKYTLAPSVFDMQLRHDDFRRNVRLDTDIIKIEDSGFENTPDSNIGKYKPIVIGDFTSVLNHRNGIGYFTNTSGTVQFGYGNFFKCLIYDSVEDDVIKALASNHELKETGSFTAFYESNADRFVAITGDISAPDDGLVQIDQAPSSPIFPYGLTSNDNGTSDICPISTYVPVFSSGGSGVTNYTYAIDTDPTNWSVITDNGQSVTYKTGSVSYNVSGELYWPFTVVLETEATEGYVEDALRINVYTQREEDSTLIEQTATIGDEHLNSDGQHVCMYWDTTGSPTYNVLKDTTVNIIVVITSLYGGDPAFNPAKPCKYRNLCIVRGYSARPTTEFFIQGKGVPDDVLGTYTGTLTTQPVIENPSDIIRWFAMAKGGLTASEIDSSFNTARSTFSDSEQVFAFQLNDDSNKKYLFNFGSQKGLIHELAEQCNSIVFFNNEGKLKIKVFNVDDTFPNSETNTPDDLDIFEYSGSPSSDSFTRHGIVPSSLNITQVELSDVYNDYQLKYIQNYGSNNFDEILYMDNGLGDDSNVDTNIDSDDLNSSSTLAQLKLFTSDSYNEMNSTTKSYIYEAWAINDTATATKLLQSLIEWHSRRRYIIEFDTYFSAIAFEEADFINIRTADIESTFGTATMYMKKWKIIEFSPNLSNFTIHIKAIEAEIY